MNPSTASHRLIKDLLFSFITKEEQKCFQCGGELTRDTFSVEHKIPWLHSEKPLDLFFDLDNIAFSHLGCNSRAARRPHKVYKSEADRKTASNKRRRENYIHDPVKRRERYLATGC